MFSLHKYVAGKNIAKVFITFDKISQIFSSSAMQELESVKSKRYTPRSSGLLKTCWNLILFSFCFYPLQILAEADTTAKVEKINTIEPLSMMNMLNTIMGLVVVIALILALAWAVRKYGRLNTNAQADMKILGGLSLGTREKAILVQVEGKKLLLGVAPGRVETLHVLDDIAADPSDFNKKLNDAIEAS